MNTNHEDAAGKLCIWGADDCCTLCGVMRSECDKCTGIGYHAAGCSESDDATVNTRASEFTAARPLAAGSYSGTWSGYRITLDSDSTAITCRDGIRGSMACHVIVADDGTIVVEL